jgi:DNA-directed RNA polymerase omega subunit
MTKKNSRASELDVEKCFKKSGLGRFELVIAASVRAREISRRNKESLAHEHLHSPMSALLEFQEGKIGKEYFRK